MFRYGPRNNHTRWFPYSIFVVLYFNYQNIEVTENRYRCIHTPSRGYAIAAVVIFAPVLLHLYVLLRSMMKDRSQEETYNRTAFM